MLHLRGGASASTRALPLRQLYKFTTRYRTLLIACIVTSLALGAIYTFSLTPVYSAASQILIEPRRPMLLSGGGDSNFSQFLIDSNQLEGEVQIIKSQQVIGPVVNALHLERDPELVARSGFSIFGLQKSIFDLSSDRARTGNLSGPDDLKAFGSGGDTESATIALSNFLQVRRIGQSYVLEISFSSIDPEKAARVTNSVVASYIRDRIRARIDAAQSGGEVLAARIHNLQQQQDAADSALRDGIEHPQTFPVADARILNIATVPTAKSWPKNSLVLLISIIIGLTLGYTIAAIYTGLIEPLVDIEQLARLRRFSYINAIPYDKALRNRKFQNLFGTSAIELVMRSADGPLFVECCRLEAALEMTLVTGEPLVVSVCSVSRNEGTTTVATALAAAFSRRRVPCLLLKVGSGKSPQFAGVSGSRDLVSGGPDRVADAFDASVVLGAAGGPDIAVLSGSVLRLDAMAGGPDLSAAVTYYRRKYGVIVLDLPPSGPVLDVFLATIKPDAHIFVVASGKNSEDKIVSAFSLLDLVKPRFSGLLLNRSNSV